MQNMIILPIVGIVVTTSPSLSLYKIVVFPAASRPTIRILISFFPNILNKFAKTFPMVAANGTVLWLEKKVKEKHQMLYLWTGENCG